MMCLGWDNNPICKPPDVVQVVAPLCPQVTPSAIAACPDITWFWLTAAAVGVGAMMRGAHAPRAAQ